MPRSLHVFAVALFCLAAATPPGDADRATTIAAASGTAAIDGRIDPAHSQVKFTVTKWGFVEVEGRFESFDGRVIHNADDPAKSRVDWRVRIASVRTGEKDRDDSLQQPEYFDSSRYPEMRFVSDTVRADANGALTVQGQLTIRNVTRPLTVTVTLLGAHTVPREGTFQMFRTAFVINRRDFGIVGGSVLGPVISNEVKVSLVAAVLSDPTF